jgi:hypothetical protein
LVSPLLKSFVSNLVRRGAPARAADDSQIPRLAAT